jgi:hypothetical protein
MIPSQLRLPLREISYVDVQLASEDLRDVALVDTPGLSPGDDLAGPARDPARHGTGWTAFPMGRLGRATRRV